MPGTEELRTYALTGASADAWRDLPLSEVMWEWVDVEWGVLARGDAMLRNFLATKEISFRVYGTGEVRLRSGSDPVPLASLPELEPDADPEQLRAWWVQLRFQAPSEWRSGGQIPAGHHVVRVIGMVTPDIVALYMSAAALDQVRAKYEWFIETWRPMPAQSKLVPSIDVASEELIPVTIWLFPGQVLALHAPWLEPGLAMFSGPIRARLPGGAILDLARMPQVARVTQATPAMPSGPATERVAGTPTPALTLDGTGETIAFVDSGLDTGGAVGLHPDFDATRLRFVMPPVPTDVLDAGTLSATDDASELGLGGRVATAADTDAGAGHGTHVISRAIGQATAALAKMGSQTIEFSDETVVRTSSNLKIPVGVAPKAAGVVIPVGCTVTWDADSASTYGFHLIPRDVGPLFKLAVDSGASIINNSWNYPEEVGDYNDVAVSVDRFAWEHPDVLVVFSVGNDNDGKEGPPLPPATARNVLAVGMVGYEVRGVPELAAASRRGLVADDRFRPDLLASGVGVWGARPSTKVVADGAYGEPEVDGGREIAAMGADAALRGIYRLGSGTSQAAPLVSAFAALVRQDHRARQPSAPPPSSALLRAITVLYARATDGEKLVEAEGLGLLPILPAVQALAAGEHLVLGDDRTEQLALNKEKAYTVEVPSGATSLRVALAWTDPPEALTETGALQTRLTLAATDPLGRPVRATWSSGSLQVLDVATPKEGTWTISVTAEAVAADGPHPSTDGATRAGYALAVRCSGQSLRGRGETGSHGFTADPADPGSEPGATPERDVIPTVVVQEAVMDAAAGRVAEVFARRARTKVITAAALEALPSVIRAVWVGDGAPPPALDRRGVRLCHVRLRVADPPPRPSVARGFGLSLRASIPATESAWATGATRDALLEGETARAAVIARLVTTGGQCVSWDLVEHGTEPGINWARTTVDIEAGTRQLHAVVGWGALADTPPPVVRLRAPDGRPFEMGGVTSTVEVGTGWCHLRMRDPERGRWTIEVGALPDSRERRAHVVAVTKGAPAVACRVRVGRDQKIEVELPAGVGTVTAVTALVAYAGAGMEGTCSFPVLVSGVNVLPAVRPITLGGSGPWTGRLPAPGPCTVTVMIRGEGRAGAWQRVVPPIGVE